MSNDDSSLPADAPADINDWVADLTYREAHLFTEGAFDGFRHIDPRYGKLVQGKVAADSWYYKGGFIAGWTLKSLLILGGADASTGFRGSQAVFELASMFL